MPLPWLQVGGGAGPQRLTGEVQWLWNGGVIVTGGTKKYRHYRKKGILEVNDVDYGDQGVYECRYPTGGGATGRTEFWSK